MEARSAAPYVTPEPRPPHTRIKTTEAPASLSEAADELLDLEMRLIGTLDRLDQYRHGRRMYSRGVPLIGAALLDWAERTESASNHMRRRIDFLERWMHENDWNLLELACQALERNADPADLPLIDDLRLRLSFR